MRITVIVAFLFAVLVAGSLYYLAGGPVPNSVRWEGVDAVSFEGRVIVVADDATLPDPLDDDALATLDGRSVSGSYPTTRTVWASRNATLIATSVPDGTSYGRITIVRFPTVCVSVPHWGGAFSAVCDAGPANGG